MNKANNFNKANWFNIFFISFNTLVGLIGAPLYIAHYGLSTGMVILFVFYAFATGLGITVGYHRYFAHAAYKTNNFVKFLLLFFGAAAFEQSALAWSSQHRDHHNYVDTARDPYSIKKGFFWAHMGWLIFGHFQFFYDNVEDLKRSKLVMHQARYYSLWAVGAGFVTPILIGWALGSALGGFIFGVCLRVTLVYHSTWCINSVCHMFGKSTYDIDATAKDHWLVAILTFGEGYHNFHHRFPSDYRNGIRWYDWDPSKWIIAGLSKVGLTWDLKTVSRFKILEAKLFAERKSASRKIEKAASPRKHEGMLAGMKTQYQKMRDHLLAWEKAFRETHREDAEKPKALTKGQRTQLKDAERQFKITYREWEEMLKTRSYENQEAAAV